MANVADLNLIQINNFPEVESPEDWIVVSDAAGLGYKISKENFKAFLGTVQVVAPKAISPTDPAPTLDGVYKPTVTQNEESTDIVYPGAGGLTVNTAKEVADGGDKGTSVEFIKNGAVWIKNGYPLPQTDLTGVIRDSDLDKEPSTNQLFNKNDYRHNTRVNSDGTLSVFADEGSTNDMLIPEGVTTLSWSGLTDSPAKRIAWFKENGDFISINLLSLSNATIPIVSGAAYFVFNFKRNIDNTDILNTFMLNFGFQIPYEEYKEVIVGINGIPFKSGSVPPSEEVDVRLKWHYNDTDAPVTGTNLYSQFTVTPDKDVAGDTVGCTGSSYNRLTQEYVISYYSFDKESKLWFFKRKDLVDYSATGNIVPAPTREIDVSAYIYHIQGNVYDPETNTYWVLGSMNPVSSDTERLIIRVDDEGNLLERFEMTAFSFQAGMLCLSPDLQNLMIKPNNKPWVLELDKITKTQIRQSTVATSNEGLGVDYSNAIVWVAGDNGSLYKYAYSDMSLLATFPYETLPNNPTTNQNSEGIIIDIDGAILFIADAFLHGGNINGNGMWVFDFEKTIGKSIYLPEMISLVNNESPIIDFGGTNDLIEAEILQGSGTIQYRGSNTAPTFPIVSRENWRDRPYFEGWGSTMPSAWSDNFTGFRYMQARVI